jgi:hypothetical protein
MTYGPATGNLIACKLHLMYSPNYRKRIEPCPLSINLLFMKSYNWAVSAAFNNEMDHKVLNFIKQ